MQKWDMGSAGRIKRAAGWLYRTARNLAIDALRRERTHAGRAHLTIEPATRMIE